jgi:hypothetical protein
VYEPLAQVTSGESSLIVRIHHELLPYNAAPEWQAGSQGWRSRSLVEACPLEGLVRPPFSIYRYYIFIHLEICDLRALRPRWGLS